MATTERFTVTAEDNGLRLDQMIARHVPDLSRRRARLVIDLGGVFVDRTRVKQASRQLRPGQVVEVNLGGAFDRATPALGADARARDAEELPKYDIVFEDDDVVVVNKPAGLVTAPTPESDRGNLLDLLSRRAGASKAMLVHRIDRPTSGLLVFAKNDEANRVLAQAFVIHDIEREYRVVVVGAYGGPATIDRPILDKRAVTHVTTLETFANATLLSARLETGRSHQIRIHLAGEGNPVAGDQQHGGDVSRTFSPRPPRLALHARVLGFKHPRTGAAMRFEREVPADLNEWMGTLLH